DRPRPPRDRHGRRRLAARAAGGRRLGGGRMTRLVYARAVPRRPIAVLLTAAALLSACASNGRVAPLYDAQRSVERYIASGEYDRDFARVAADAQAWLERRVKTAARPAIVLDIDETSLS